MYRLLLFVFSCSLILTTVAGQNIDQLEANHLKVILQQKHHNLLSGKFNLAITVAENIVDGQKITKMVKYSICEGKAGLVSFYTETDNHAVYIVAYIKEISKGIKVVNAVHILKNDRIIGQVDVTVTFNQNQGYSIQTKNNIISRETGMIALCVENYRAKVLTKLRSKKDSRQNALRIANYILTRLYSQATKSKFEEITNRTISEEMGGLRCKSRCYGDHPSYGFMAILGPTSQTSCVKVAGECGCYQCTWYAFYVYCGSYVCH